MNQRTSTPDVDKIRQMFTEQDRTARKTKERLLATPPGERWQTVREVLAGLEKDQARDLVRLLFHNNQDFVEDKLKEEEEIITAIACLGYLPSAGAVQVLVELLNHPEGTIQLAAVEALKNQIPRQVIPVLLKALLYERVLPARAGEVLLDIGTPALEAIMEVYPVALPKVKTHFLELLVMGQYPKCKELVRRALEDSHKELLPKALDAVASFGFTDLWLEASRCLSSQMPWPIRSKALNTLEVLGLPESRATLQLLLADEDEWIRENAMRILAVLAEK